MSFESEFRNAALYRSKVVAAALMALIALGAILGFVIESKNALAATAKESWGLLLWAVTLGGTFWGAITVGTIAASTSFWLGWSVGLFKAHNRQAAISVIVVMALIWLLACIGVYSTFESAGSLDAYQKMAVVLLHFPVALIFYVFNVMLFLATDSIIVRFFFFLSSIVWMGVTVINFLFG